MWLVNSSVRLVKSAPSSARVRLPGLAVSLELVTVMFLPRYVNPSVPTGRPVRAESFILGQPNVFVAISPEQVERKIKIVLEVFSTQTSKDWLDADTLRAILRLRGVESNASERHAEAFYAPKLVLEL